MPVLVGKRAPKPASASPGRMPDLDRTCATPRRGVMAQPGPSIVVCLDDCRILYDRLRNRGYPVSGPVKGSVHSQPRSLCLRSLLALWRLLVQDGLGGPDSDEPAEHSVPAFLDLFLTSEPCPDEPAEGLGLAPRAISRGRFRACSPGRGSSGILRVAAAVAASTAPAALWSATASRETECGHVLWGILAFIRNQ